MTWQMRLSAGENPAVSPKILMLDEPGLLKSGGRKNPWRRTPCDNMNGKRSKINIGGINGGNDSMRYSKGR